MERDNLNWTRGTPAAHRTRGALADLSRQLAGVTVTLLSTPNSNIQLPSSMMSPAPSPDEMIITLRGRKKAPPITWSPLSQTGVQKFSQYEITPPKGRTSPREIISLILLISLFVLLLVQILLPTVFYWVWEAVQENDYSWLKLRKPPPTLRQKNPKR